MTTRQVRTIDVDRLSLNLARVFTRLVAFAVSGGDLKPISPDELTPALRDAIRANLKKATSK